MFVDVLINKIANELPSSIEFNNYKYRFAAYLIYKYPLPKTLELGNILIDKCKQFGGKDGEIAGNALHVCITVLRAFPTLMAAVAPLLVTWSSLFKDNQSFMKESENAARQIGIITAAVSAPLYRRSFSIDPSCE